MNRDEIIRLAMKAGLLDKVDCSDDYFIPGDAFVEEIEAFAKLVAETEREACAKLCEETARHNEEVGCDIDLLIGNMECATAIRARGET